MILAPQVLTILILDGVILFFASVTFFLSFKIALWWDMQATTQRQYTLEKQSHLAATIIKYILALKIALFLFFIYTIDDLANIVIGAMCGAGVINATSYGIYLMIFKIIDIYLFAYWLILHKKDISNERLLYTKIKFTFFLLIYVLLVIETLLEFSMFNAIDPQVMVSCCGSIYSATSSSAISAIFKVDTKLLLGIFYANFIAIAVSFFLKKRYLFTLSNFLYIIITITALIVFFGTYIYELPTHHCPFCLLQKGYYFIGYFIYVFLFIGTFYGLVVGFLDDAKKNYFVSFIFDTATMMILSAYPLVFYFKNGVWL